MAQYYYSDNTSKLKNTSNYVWFDGLFSIDDLKDKKDFYVYSSGYDVELDLNKLSKDHYTDKSNPNIYFAGGAGDDKLSYSGNQIKKLNISLSSNSAYDLHFDGGYWNVSHANFEEFNSLDVLTSDVHSFDLTVEDDTVDLRVDTGAGDSEANFRFYTAHASTTVWSWDLDEGRDDFFGSRYSEVVYGGDGSDTIYGADGDDTIYGDDGNDILHGEDGNDIIYAGNGADTVEGGAGNDIIYAYTDLNSEGINTIYGDKSSMGAGEFNEKDIFFIGYDTEKSLEAAASQEDLFLNTSNIGTGVGVIGDVGSTLLKAGGYTGASAAVSIGFTVGSAILDTYLNSGKDAEAQDTTSDIFSNEILIEDFDAWGDTVIVALDEYASLVNASAGVNGNGDGTLDFVISSAKFLQLTLADRLSIFEDEAAAMENLGNVVHQNAILENLLLNSLIVEQIDGEENVRTLSGIQLNADGEQDAALQSLFSDSNADEGVWILGDFGSSILFGNGKSALAGTNSDNIMYSGTHSSSEAAWHSTTAITSFGGGGQDIIIGSSAQGDILYGGTDNDYLHGFSGIADQLYGGQGTDTASFATIYDYYGTALNAVAGQGVYANLSLDVASSTETMTADISYYVHTTERDALSAEILNGNLSPAVSSVPTGGQFAVTGTAAYLYEIENLEGSDYDDLLVGDANSNELNGQLGDDVIAGDGGNDTIIGGGGNDTLSGGTGADSFTFSSGFGADTITDFESGDKIVFTGLNSAEVSSLSSALGQSGSVITLGSDNVTVTGFDVSTLSYGIVQDGSHFDVSVYAYLTRAEDPTPLSDAEAVRYLASHDDLIAAYGYNLAAAKSHFETNGRNEARQLNFDGTQYLSNYSDLAAAYGSDTDAAARHYVIWGYGEGRSYADNITDTLAASAATASSEYASSNAASMVLDGDADTFNHTARGDTAQWLKIDLGGDTWIDGISIQNRNDGSASHQAIVNARLSGATVEIYDDGVRVSQTTLTSDVTQWIDLNGVMGDELRIYSNDGDHLHVAEIDVLGYANLTDSLDGSAASQSSTYNASAPASHILDGDVTTINHTGRNDPNPWVSIDLGQDALIQLVEIENRQDNWTSSRLAGANVEVLDDGNIVWTSADLTTAHSQSINVGGIVGDQVRIYDAGGDWLHVAELDVYGSFL